MENERLKKLVEEAVEKLLTPDERADDPDPETVKKIEELEEEDDRTPDGLLLDVLEDVRDLIDLTVNETEEWGASPEQMIEINKNAAELAGVAVQMYDRLMVGKTLEKLCFMRSVEQKNDENIRKWSDDHEQSDGSPRGDQSEG